MSRRVKAVLYRWQGREQVELWTRHYSWMDTAVPRATQLAMHDNQSGDVVIFTSIEFGFELGQLRVKNDSYRKTYKGSTRSANFQLELSDLALKSPNLMKLF